MNGYRYKSVLSGGFANRPQVETGVAEIRITDDPKAPSFGLNAPLDVVVMERTEANSSVTLAAGNPIPALGWQGAMMGGTFTPLTNGNAGDPDAYHFNTLPNLSYAAVLWFRAWGDQDASQFGAVATNASGKATSPPARLLVQVPTDVALTCPADLVHGFGYTCHVTVLANPQRGPRPRKPCGQVTVHVAPPNGPQQTCTLDPNGTCDVTLPYPGDNTPAIPHHVSYPGDSTGCAGGIVPPDLPSEEAFSIRVGGCEAPEITTCPAGRSVDLSGSCTAPVPEFLPAVSVNDPGCEVSLSQDPAAGTPLGAGIHTVTITATTTEGSDTCSATFTVRDVTPPTITIDAPLPSPVIVECHTTYDDAGATAQDCAGSLPVTTSGSVNTLVPGRYTITYEATDSSGNTGTATRTVDVVDTTPPDLTCPSAPAPASADASCRAPVPDLASLATATDHCSAPGQITITQSPAPGTLVGLGAHTITITARDAAGRESTCSRSFDVVDTTRPAISCPGSITNTAPAGSCSAVVSFAATPSDSCGTPTVGYSHNPGSSFPIGTTTVTATATDGAGYTAQCTFDVTVLAFTAATAVTVSPPTRQYSDRVTFTATVLPAAAASGSVTFYVGTQSMGSAPLDVTGTATLSNVALLESPALPSNGQMAPGTNRTVTAVFTPSGSCYLTPNATANLVIAKENAWAEFTGDSFYSICPTCTSTTVTFVALVKDVTAVSPATDSDPGVIQNATVSFVEPGSGAVYCSAPVGLVNAGDTQTGLASCTKQIPLGTCPGGVPCSSITIDVGLRVNGYYDRAAAYGDAVITISQNLQSGMVSGGGHLVLSASAGRLAGDAGRKSNFGFNIKYNKKYTNLQGSVNTIVRRLESDGVVHLYQVKGNSMQSLAVDLVTTGSHPFPTAIFTGKASIQDVTNPQAPVSIDGGATFRLSMTDKGEPGKDDTLGISVFAAQNKGGGLWYSSSWTGTTTVEQVLGGGSIAVR